jgi:hypothetical protein
MAGSDGVFLFAVTKKEESRRTLETTEGNTVLMLDGIT